MDFTIFFDIFSTIGFCLALLMVYRIQKNLLGHPSRFFLIVFLVIYLFISISNILRHGGVIDFLDRYAYIAELLIPPVFLFFIFPIFSLYIFSLFMRQDIIKREKAEEDLSKSQERYKYLFEFSHDGVAIFKENNIVTANQAFLELLGYDSLEEIPLGSLEERLFPACGERLASVLKNVEMEDGSTRYECVVVQKDGNILDVELTIGAITLDDERLIQCHFHDITERKQAEKAISRAKNEWERTFDTVPDQIAILDDQNRVMRINQPMAMALGTTKSAMIGNDLHQFIQNEEEPLYNNEMTANLAKEENEKQISSEIYDKNPDKHYLVSLSPVKDEEHETIGFVRVARDISELKKVENELAKTKAFLQSIIDGVSDSIMVIDRNYRILLMNKTASERHAIPWPFQKDLYCYKISHGSDQPCDGDEHPCPLIQVAKSKKSVTLTHQHKRHDGTPHMLEIAASPIINGNGEVTGIIEVGRDVTEKIRLEGQETKLRERIHHQQKDQSVARLAQGMAHDFNNLLGTVSGNIELLQMREGIDKEDAIAISSIQQASQKMIELTSQLLAYAKGGAYQRKSIPVNDIIKKTLSLLKPGNDVSIRIDLDLTENLWPVLADPNQIQQLLVNLFTNAYEAMGENGGTLSIITQNRKDKDEWECSQNRIHPGGNYIQLTITDTGEGLPDLEPSMLFEPFYTTKGMGRGLGLAAAIGIIHLYSGCITAQNTPGKGATFHIFLPVMEEIEDNLLINVGQENENTDNETGSLAAHLN